MIKRQDIILNKVKELSLQALERHEEPGVTAQEAAELLKMDRGNVSKELNQLAASEKLLKKDGRPVRFSDPDTYDQYIFLINSEKIQQASSEERQDVNPSFQDIIGQEGSLKMQIKQVKAAMLYPPHGLHTLLNGPTGTGKTMFAQKMFEYARHMNMLKPDAEFVIFNCAEYAENSQLIVSQIFGHKKGAFTGADRDKPGLIERADGGILFLDEIHRLPPEGQEMLFSLMDYGKYRRLGETERNREANVLIIGATTEDLGVVLLKTFMRRMPVVIQLPALEERPLLERLEMIEMFLMQEQKKISVSIKIEREVILSLLLYECTGNIGQIKADIQLLCARAFWEYKVGEKHTVDLDRQMLPFYIEQGYHKAAESRNSLIQFLLHGEEHYIFTIGTDQGENRQNIISKKYLIFQKFYSKKKGAEQEQEMKDYISSMIEKENEDRRIFSKDALNKVITGKVYYAIEEALEFAEMKLKRELSDNVKIGFALHINALIEGMDKKGDILEERLQEIINAHPKEVKVAKLILKILEEELNININKGEIGYTTIFLCANEEDREVRKIGTIVIAHGDNTAQSIADAANRLLDTSHCKFINMPLSEDVEEVYRKAAQMVTRVNEGRGVLLMVDMGSLNMFAERLEEETGIPVKSVGMVSTLTVLEAVRKCTSEDSEIEEVADYLDQMMVRMVEENKRQKNTETCETRAAILVTCISGMGAAKKIAEMVKAITGLEEEDPIEICCIGIDGKDAEGTFLGGFQEKEVLAVVGTADIQLGAVPYISVDEIVIGSGIERLERILSGKNAGKNYSEKKGRAVDEHVLTAAMRELLEFLDAEKIMPMILEGFYQCEKRLDIKDQENRIVRYTIHVACMIERLLRKEILPYHEVEEYERSHSEEFKAVGETLETIEKMFRIEVPFTEKAYIVELLNGEGKS